MTTKYKSAVVKTQTKTATALLAKIGFTKTFCEDYYVKLLPAGASAADQVKAKQVGTTFFELKVTFVTSYLLIKTPVGVAYFSQLLGLVGFGTTLETETYGTVSPTRAKLNAELVTLPGGKQSTLATALALKGQQVSRRLLHEHIEALNHHGAIAKHGSGKKGAPVVALQLDHGGSSIADAKDTLWTQTPGGSGLGWYSTFLRWGDYDPKKPQGMLYAARYHLLPGGSVSGWQSKVLQHIAQQQQLLLALNASARATAAGKPKPKAVSFDPSNLQGSNLLAQLTLIAMTDADLEGVAIEIIPPHPSSAIPANAPKLPYEWAAKSAAVWGKEVGRLLAEWVLWLGHGSAIKGGLPSPLNNAAQARFRDRDIEIVLRFASEMNLGQEYGYIDLYKASPNATYESTAKQYRAGYKALVDAVRSGAAEAYKTAAKEGAIIHGEPASIAKSVVRFAIVLYQRSREGATTPGTGSLRVAGQHELMQLLPKSGEDIDYIGFHIYGFDGYHTGVTLRALRKAYLATWAHYEKTDGAPNHIGILIPEMSSPLLRWREWAYWAGDAVKNPALFPSDPDPKANDTGKAIKWRLQDLVAGWWYRAVIDGVRAIQADVVRTTKSLAPRVVFIQFESNKPTERGWAYRPVAHGAAFALSSLEPWGAWANTQAITTSGGQAILDGKPVYGVDLGPQDMTVLEDDLNVWELLGKYNTLLPETVADLQANLRPPALPPPTIETAPKSLLDTVKYKTHRQRFVDHDGLRPDDVLSSYSEAVAGASWAELRDKLLPKLDKGGTSLLKADWLAGALAELDSLYTPPKP